MWSQGPWGIQPVAFSVLGYPIYWYGLLHVVGITWVYWLLARERRLADRPWSEKELDDFCVLVLIGVLLGGRLGYLLLYEPGVLLKAPLAGLDIRLGRSFHGGLVGVALALMWHARRYSRSFLTLTDALAPHVPLAIALGRLGNFINGELWGQITTMPWGVVFPLAGSQPRHATPLYEMVLEGIVLWAVLRLIRPMARREGQMTGAFLVGYAVFRILVEHWRVPQGGWAVAGLWLSYGQWYCLPMLAGGMVCWIRGRRSS